MFLTGGNGQLGKGHAGEGVGENVVGRDDGLTLAGEGEIEVEITVVAVLLQEFGALAGAGKPGGILLYLII